MESSCPSGLPNKPPAVLIGTACVLEASKGGTWHQSANTFFPEPRKSTEGGEGFPILDFDLLCANVALNQDPLSFQIHTREGGGVQRMWEDEVFDCLEDGKTTFRTACCPCITFGKSMERAGFGTCFGQGATYFTLVASAAICFGLFLFIMDYLFLFLSIGLLLIATIYAGYYRNKIRRRFNIKGNEDDFLTAVDDHVNHIFCGCCALCQEARTLEINNVQDGNWHGRGDRVLLGCYPQTVDMNEPVIISISKNEYCSKDLPDHEWNTSSISSSLPLMENH